MSATYFKLKRKEIFNNQVLLDLAYLLVDRCHVHVIHVGLFNHAENVSLNTKIDKVLDSEYTLDYLREKKPEINYIKLASADSQGWIQINRNGKIATNQAKLFKHMKPVIKAYFKG